MNIDGRTFINDGNPNLGAMSFSEALIQSCDTVYYDIGYQMWQTDDNKANSQLNPNAPTQKMQQMELDWGFGKNTGVDLPEESTGTIPTRQWLYNMWEDNAHKGQNWCKNGKANGSYVQQIEYDDCQSGWVWEPGQAAIAAIGQGYVTSTPLQLTNAYTALANGGTLYSPRIGEALVSPSGKVVQKINPPVIRHAARLVGDPRLHPLRAGRRGHPGHRGRARSAGSRSTRSAWRARPVPRRSRARTRPRCSRRSRPARTPSSWSSSCCRTPVTAPTRRRPPSARSGTASTASRARRRRCPAGSSRPSPVPGRRRCSDEHGAAMSVGLPSRGWAGPRAGTFAPRRRSVLARAFAKGGVARSWDWPLIFVTCALTVLGTVLVWAATEPSLRQVGLDPHTYLKKAALWAFLGLDPDVRHRVDRLPADQALDPGHLRPVAAAPARGARRRPVGERREGLDRAARRLPG